MVWSLSKDDDGLESVSPSGRASALLATGRPAAPSPPRPPASFARANSATASAPPPAKQAQVEVSSPTPSPQAGPSVVVDPTSQIPEASSSRQFTQRTSVEKTEVLKGRRLDSLRAEVEKRRKSHERKRRNRLLLWGIAGAGAVLFGGFLAGVVLKPASSLGLDVDSLASSPDSPEDAHPTGVVTPGDSAQPSSPSEKVVKKGGASVDSPASEAAPAVAAAPPVAAAPVAAPAAPEASLGIALEDLPMDDEESEADSASPSEPQAAASQAISLDDLPFE